MCGMLENVNDFIQTTVGNMPVAVLTIALLATPTILYFIYRFSVGSASHGRSRTSATPFAQWVCPSCHSVNELSARRCYSCAYDVGEFDDVLVIDPVTAKPISLPDQPAAMPVGQPGVAVGPGAPVPSMASAAPTVAATPVVPATLPTTIPGAPGSPGVPVGPGRPVGVPATRTPATSSIGAAVGARRPFDPPTGSQPPLRRRGPRDRTRGQLGPSRSPGPFRFRPSPLPAWHG